jgi:hypothetical protein
MKKDQITTGGIVKPCETEANRSVESLSMLWPLADGDRLELDGPAGGNLWQLSRSSAGWYLHKPGNRIERHPTIHGIDGMGDLIGAILDHAKGYQ